MQQIPFFNNTSLLSKLPVVVATNALRQSFIGNSISRNIILCFALSGETLYTINDSSSFLTAGTCAISPPYTIRRRNTLKSEETPLLSTVAFFDDFLTERGYDYFPYGGELAQFNGCKIPRFCNLSECSDKATQVIRNALDEFNLKSKMSYNRIASLLAELFGLICTEPVAPPNRSFRKQVSNITKTIKYIENNFADKLTIDKLCEISDMSRRSFTCHFKSITGMTVTNFLLSVRLNRAANLLAMTDKLHDEIAVQTGLGDHSNLAYVFSKYIGLTPSEIRYSRHSELYPEAKNPSYKKFEWVNEL